jgi:hypothetical protein
VAAFGSLIGSLNGDKRTVGLLNPVLVKFFSIEDNPMRTLHFAVAALGLLSIQPASAQNNPNLFPKIEKASNRCGASSDVQATPTSSDHISKHQRWRSGGSQAERE